MVQPSLDDEDDDMKCMVINIAKMLIPNRPGSLLNLASPVKTTGEEIVSGGKRLRTN
jgi:hypothetical protein